MKNLLELTFFGLFLAGCTSVNHEGTKSNVLPIDLDDNVTRLKIVSEAIDVEQLETGGKCCEEMCYAPNQETPYSGWGKFVRLNGEVGFLGHYKEGLEDGIWIYYYGNWRKKLEANYKQGKLVTSEAWKPNGKKCPLTNVKDGNGVQVWYNKDGTEYNRITYEKGEVVED